MHGKHDAGARSEDSSHERPTGPHRCESRPAAPVRGDESHHRAKPAHHAVVHRTPGERAPGIQSPRARGGVEGVPGVVAADADRSPAPRRSAGRVVAGLREAVGEHRAAHGRGGGGTRGDPRTGRPPVQGRGLVREPALRPHQAELPPRVEVHAVDGARDRRARRPHRAQGGLLHPPVHRRPGTDELRDDEPRGGEAHRRDGRRKPRAGAFQHARGPRARSGTAPGQNDRSGEVQAGGERRRQPRQGRLRERSDAASPVRARHGDGAQAAPAHRSAVDQQVLHPRPPSEELVHQVGRGPGPHRVRHLLGESGRAAGRKDHERLPARRPRRGAGGGRAGDRRVQRQRDRVLPGRHPARRNARVSEGWGGSGFFGARGCRRVRGCRRIA